MAERSKCRQCHTETEHVRGGICKRCRLVNQSELDSEYARFMALGPDERAAEVRDALKRLSDIFGQPGRLLGERRCDVNPFE